MPLKPTKWTRYWLMYASYFALEDGKQFISRSSPLLLFCRAAGILTICAILSKNITVERIYSI